MASRMTSSCEADGVSLASRPPIRPLRRLHRTTEVYIDDDALSPGVSLPDQDDAPARAYTAHAERVTWRLPEGQA